MKLVARLILIFSLLPAIVGQAAALSSKQQSSIAPELAARLESDAAGTEYSVLVRLTDSDASRDRLNTLAASAVDLTDRYQQIGGQLRASATSARFRASGNATVVRRFWISNIVEMRVDAAALIELAGRDDVVMVAPNVSIELLQPVSITDATSASVGASSNLQSIGVRSLWDRGITGKGRLVASIDTGVEGIHPALADRWHGKHGDTTASWFDPLNGRMPIDNSGHGTHVMGIMVGRDGADTIGLAPDAEWICAAVVDRGRSLSATFADILAALQWVVDPDGNPETMDDVPDVVCNSWGVSQQIISPCDQLFFEAIDNVESMGVVCVFAAGNEGPYSMSIRNPADRATSPTASFSVGAVDANTSALEVPSFSSRGPSACDGVAKKPEIAAPGVSIRSAYKGQTYKLINGTSMAAPHVAAAVALLRQYNPELTPEQIKMALLSTARDIGTPGEDNASGKGMVDLEAAIASLPSPNYPVVTAGKLALTNDNDGVPALGESVALVIPVSGAVVDANNITLHLTSLSSVATVDAGSSYIGTIPVGGTVTNAADPFAMQVSAAAQAGDTAWFEVRMTGNTLMNWWRDTVGVMIGLPSGATLATTVSGPASLTLSNFGQIGLAQGSALNAGGSGWRSSQIGANILYEGALMISSADGWVDGSRRDNGTQRFDFQPTAAGANHSLCFDDAHGLDPVGVAISQSVLPVYRTGSYEITTVSWTVRNVRSTTINNLRLAWLTDIDLPGVGAIDETVGIDPTSGGFFHVAPYTGIVAGLAPLSGTFGGLNFFENLGGKQSLTSSAKQQSLVGRNSIPSESGDYFCVSATNAVNLNAGDSLVFAVAFITAIDAGSFTAASGEARNRWLTISDVNDGQGGGVQLPSDYALAQNYPNPFNAGTTIPVEIAGDGTRMARLEIIDLLGRRVRTLLDESAVPGVHPIFWDARDDNGHPVASGVYFARLLVSGQPQQVRSMVLLK